MREFHIARTIRERYELDDTLFSLSGNAVFANFHAVRQFAQKVNQKRDLVNFPERAVKAGQINAMGLIDEILHLVVTLYGQRINPEALQQAYEELKERLGAKNVDQVLSLFTGEFPPTAVFRRQKSVEEYLEDSTDGTPNRLIALEELLLLWVANMNPAFEPFGELFDDRSLSSDTAYLQVIRGLSDFFKKQPAFGPESLSLVDLLRAPAIAVPNSLEGQLDYLRTRWGDLLGQYLYRLLTSVDLIHEEERMRMLGPGPVPVPLYDLAALSAEQAGLEVERFSQDREWMPRLVLMAKNSYVWLHQLSKEYGRPIRRLDEIPEEELKKLADWGFSGLWLIGLWERSAASALIKQLGGNADAIASAYSIAYYQIAEDLGGEQAYQVLREKAWRYGIRLASDMVPNHMGIDSPWVINHPEWFVQLDYSPFPSYSFTGPDLSNHPKAAIHLEDHYFDRTDAAVVFQRVDRENGRTSYIYHGNDGTSMPWNDTAQLNYLVPQVREAVIQTILDVARRFPIIRFDAAMTLAKKHYQRLWYPEPGGGGAIPSRAEHGLTRAQFDQVFPVEFWREVVDRVAQEVPDTLLLAEAFWLMEGYFVRTLGMHRVYNSAFMNMLRNEENANYRLVMKNTLEFDPEILKRYVNFMNNPDERTAVDQFGKGDKYFGVAVLMATLPGLPMFGHGQIEGFGEKYGMEFKKPLQEETPDSHLVERHQRELFPLLHRRPLFSGAENFLLYDLFTQEGGVNEDVYAYSNGLGSERTLVVFNNRYADARGWIRTSVAVLNKTTQQLIQRSLGEGLSLEAGAGQYVLFRDSITNLEYILDSREIVERGMYLELGAYQYRVFLDFRTVGDDRDGSYRHLSEYLGSRGVPSVAAALHELRLAPVVRPFGEIANPRYFQYLLENRLTKTLPDIPADVISEAVSKMGYFLQGIHQQTGFSANLDDISMQTGEKLGVMLRLNAIEDQFPVPGGSRYQSAIEYLRSGLERNPTNWISAVGWIFTHSAGRLAGEQDYAARSQSWLEEWKLGRMLVDTAEQLGMPAESAWQVAPTVEMLIGQQDWFRHTGRQKPAAVMSQWLSQEEIQRYLGVNRYRGKLWFNQEALENFLWWMMLLAVIDAAPGRHASATLFHERLLSAHNLIQQIQSAADHSGYQVDRLLENLNPVVPAEEPVDPPARQHSITRGEQDPGYPDERNTPKEG